MLRKDATDNLAKAGQWATKRKEYLRHTQALADAAIRIGPLLPSDEVWPELRSWQITMWNTEEFLNRKLVANRLEDALREAHVSYALLPSSAGFAHYQVLVLQDNVELDEETAQGIREFVSKVGNLFAEGDASLIDADGKKRSNFASADILGVDFEGYSPHVVANYVGGSGRSKW